MCQRHSEMEREERTEGRLTEKSAFGLFACLAESTHGNL
jgi:hypothetical protein